MFAYAFSPISEENGENDNKVDGISENHCSEVKQTHQNEINVVDMNTSMPRNVKLYNGNSDDMKSNGCDIGNLNNEASNGCSNRSNKKVD